MYVSMHCFSCFKIGPNLKAPKSIIQDRLLEREIDRDRGVEIDRDRQGERRGRRIRQRKKERKEVKRDKEKK
jgi:hypothetical protein